MRVPQELVDVSLCERFGWTWTELGEQDEAQVLPAVAAANVSAALGRVKAWLNAAGAGAKVGAPGEADWKMWKAAQDAWKQMKG